MSEKVDSVSYDRETGLIPAGHPAPCGDLITQAVDDTQAVHNFDGSPAHQFKLTALAIGQTCKGGRESVGETIHIQYWYAHRCSSVNDHGEIESWYRTVLITPEGRAYAFGSTSVFKMLCEIIKHFGRGKLDPPVVVKVRQIVLGPDRSMISLEPVEV